MDLARGSINILLEGLYSAMVMKIIRLAYKSAKILNGMRYSNTPWYNSVPQ